MSGRAAFAAGVGVCDHADGGACWSAIGVIGGEVTMSALSRCPQLFAPWVQTASFRRNGVCGRPRWARCSTEPDPGVFGLAGNVSIGDLLLASVMPGL